MVEVSGGGYKSGWAYLGRIAEDSGGCGANREPLRVEGMNLGIAQKGFGDRPIDEILRPWAIGVEDLNGIELTRQIRAQAPGCRVLMLSDRADPDAVTEALRVGAAGYALKTISPTELLRALATVADGKVYLSPEIAGVVVDQHLRGGRAAEETGPLLDLTPREREVLQLLAEGHTTKEIASRLFISPKTVGSHRQHIMNKLDLHTVADLTRCAIRLGLASVRR